MGRGDRKRSLKMKRKKGREKKKARILRRKNATRGRV